MVSSCLREGRFSPVPALPAAAGPRSQKNSRSQRPRQAFRGETRAGFCPIRTRCFPELQVAPGDGSDSGKHPNPPGRDGAFFLFSRIAVFPGGSGKHLGFVRAERGNRLTRRFALQEDRLTGRFALQENRLTGRFALQEDRLRYRFSSRSAFAELTSQFYGSDGTDQSVLFR